MTSVEQIYPGFQWADPPGKGSDLEVEQVGSELQIGGLSPNYRVKDPSTDLIRQFERAPNLRPVGQKRIGKQSPDIRFANADSDEKLIAFVRRFGPVVAKDVRIVMIDEENKKLQVRLIARQDMQELRNEQVIYGAAMGLVNLLSEQEFDYGLAQTRIRQIAGHLSGWPQQWERERAQRESEHGAEPFWKLTSNSLKRIQALGSSRPDGLLPPTLDGRIVICEVLNSFRSAVFPNPVEMHSSIRYGIRPLLYSILRRQFLGPRDFAVCANTQCRNFFNVERAGGRFCSTECSQHERQRTYWSKRGKQLRRKRLKRSRVAKVAA